MRSLLIVEDNPTARSALARLLVRLGGDALIVYTAATLEEGVKISREKSPEVVLLDLLLPDSPSWRDTIKRIPDFKGSIIIITGMDLENGEKIREAALNAGATQVFTKSFFATNIGSPILPLQG